MEYVGRRVKKEFQERGTFFGSVQAYFPATGFFKIVYDDGNSEEMEWSEVSSLLATFEPPPRPHPHPPGLSANRSGGKPEERSCIVNKGVVDENSVICSSISCNSVDRSGNSSQLDLNVCAGIGLNEVGDHGGNLGKLHGLDLNEGVNLVLHEGLDLNTGIMEESCGVRREMIDLNMGINEEIENVSGERKVRWFDLNLELTEDEVMDLHDHEEELGGNGRSCAAGDKQTGKELVMDDNENLVNAYGDKRKVILNSENKLESRPENGMSGVDYAEEAPVSAPKSRRVRKRKEVLDNKIELAAPKLFKVDAETRNLKLKLERTEEIPFEKASASVGYDGASGSALRGRSRKRRESSNNNITLATPEAELRRRSRRAKRASFPGQDYALNAGGIYDQLSSPADSAVPDGKVSMLGSAKPEKPVPLPKVELPPSSSCLDLSGVSVFDFFSVYAFLRSFSTFLFLSPFELDDFLTCLRCNDSTLLFDSIHFSLLRTLRIHLESLSGEGSASASVCLRSLNWNFLDLITWPVFLVEYLLLHCPVYIPGLDLCHFEPFQNDYYKMPASAKVFILRHLCDNVIQAEAFRSELNRRTLITEQHTQNMKVDSSKRKKAVMDVASTSCITGEDADEPADWNSDECCLCKMDGNLICCDGCPAAFHSRCVGVVSSLLPDGDWYCPECAFDKDKPFKMGKSVRGAELLGTDPHGVHYYSSCGYLLVLELCNDEYSFWFYNRNDLPALIEMLESLPFVYDEIISAICKHWDVIYGVDGMRNDIKSRSCSMQSAFPQTRLLSIRHQTPPETLCQDAAFAEKRYDEKSPMTTYSNNIEHETSGLVNAMLETFEDGIKMENQFAGSEGSAEVSQASPKTDTLKESGLGCSKSSTEISDDSPVPGNLGNAGDHYVTSTTVKTEEGKNLSSGNYGDAFCGIVSHGIEYINYYEFARTASSVSEELASKSSDKSCEDVTRSVEEIVAGQLRVISNRFAHFSWSNIQNLNANSRKEKCGFCFYCKVPEDGRDCLFTMNDSIPAVESFTSEVLNIQSGENRINHLTDVICHVVCIEDHLQGLLMGPWLNPHYSQLWRKSVLEAADLAALKNMLLKLESNLHHLALSADWRKHVDSVVTMGSASHIVRRSTRVPLRLGISRRKAKCSKLEITPSSKAAMGLSLFWWRGGRASRKLFNWKVLPHSLASKAGRQGGCRKILAVHYPDSGEYAKRMKHAAWRAAVESSTTVGELALQIRELDANIRWDDIGNTNRLAKTEKESKKSNRSFTKVIIRRKCHDGKVVKYLLDFGKRRSIPDIVLRHGSMLEDSSTERKKYWLEESHVPLHLLKAFEEKRIVRKSSKVLCGELHESSREMRNPYKEKGFPYLFSRAERSEKYQCAHCDEDVLIREAVGCQHCKGFFHERHAWKSAASFTSEPMYTCHKCQDGNFVQIDARKEQPELPKRKKAFKAPKPCSEARKKLVKDKQPVHSEERERVPLVVRLRRSVRNADCVLKLFLQNMKVNKRKRGKQAKPKKDELEKIINSRHKKKRATINSSYWLNGLQLSRRRNDERLMHFRSKMLLMLSGEEIPISNKPKCSLCGELEYTSNLNYVACEICGVWFHGDALDLKADKIQKIIGFKCHNCLNKRPIVCPHQCPTGSNKTSFVSENTAENECNVEDSNGFPTRYSSR